MPLQATSGAASYDAFGGGVPVVPNYIEEVFSTYLYTGNSTSGGTQSITNSIDLSTKGGLVWIKGRSAAANNMLYDTTRGAGTGATSGTNKALSSNLTSAQGIASTSDYLSAFSTTGFSVTQGGATTALRSTNYNNVTYCSWTFREQPKFFDVVTFTTDASSNATFSQSLGSSPGCVIFKKTGGAENWFVWHRSLPSTNYYLGLNTTAAQATTASPWISVSSTSISVMGAHLDASSAYVAYLFAHDAGGFGLTGTDNVISCGSWTASSTVAVNVTLGYEPQFVLVKNASAVQNWFVWDTMRGMPVDTAQPYLHPNLSASESSDTYYLSPTATGFTVRANALGSNGNTYIYIAIRRGPMKVPTDATKVFSPIARTGTGTATTTTAGFPVDLVIDADRSKTSVSSTIVGDRMRGGGRMIYSDANSAEVDVSASNYWNFDSSTGLRVGAADNPYFNNTGVNYINWNFRRAPSFFDEVCYTGTGVTNRAITHNLAVAPQLLFVKARNNSQNWSALCTLSSGLQGRLNTTDALSAPSAAVWGNGSVYVAPTSSVFTVGTDNETNASTWTYVAYLFATCAGVSKVGSYTGNGSSQTINCGFTAGSRFVLIKKTSGTGSWYVWDSSRGIVSGNDPYLLLNSTAAEVTNTDYIDTYSAGFEISSTAPSEINENGGSFIFLAIA